MRTARGALCALLDERRVPGSRDDNPSIERPERVRSAR